MTDLKILEGSFYVTTYDKNTGIQLNKDGTYFNNKIDKGQDYYEVFTSLDLAKEYAIRSFQRNQNIELAISNHLNEIVEIIE